VFIGVSPRLTNHEDAIQTALMDAAQRLSFFISVSGASIMYERAGSGTFGSYVHFDYRLEYDDDLDKFFDILEYDPQNDVFEFNNAVFVITRVKTGISMPAFRGHFIGGDPPHWIFEPPSLIGGFSAGVGFAGPYLSHRDTVVKSYENAVIVIIENMEIHLTGEAYNYNESSIHNYAAVTQTSASGTLKHFYIIETWTDPVDLSVWTLSVAVKND
jgi:hypothetical protein